MDRQAPQRGGIVKQLRDDAPRVGISLVLDFDDAKSTSIVHQHQVRVPRRKPGFAADHEGFAQADVRRWNELRVPCQSIVEFGLSRKRGLFNHPLWLALCANQHVPRHEDERTPRLLPRRGEQHLLRADRCSADRTGGRTTALDEKRQV